MINIEKWKEDNSKASGAEAELTMKMSQTQAKAKGWISYQSNNCLISIKQKLEIKSFNK